MRLTFKKMHGLGNSFAVFDVRGGAAPVLLEAAAFAGEWARAIATQEGGAGCDQVIVLGASEKADAFMHIYNADGSESGACGNAARCAAWLLSQEFRRPAVMIETRAGLLSAQVESLARITVDMGEPRFDPDEIPLAYRVADTRFVAVPAAPPELGLASVVNVGNPHAIFWTRDPFAHDLAALGPLLETDALFPGRANISLVSVLDRGTLRLRTWERGAGLTKACGTAACASAVCAARRGLAARSLQAILPGGTLDISWTDENRILMSGPAAFEYEGEVDFEAGGSHKTAVLINKGAINKGAVEAKELAGSGRTTQEPA